MLPLPDLNAFVAVAETGSVRAAADRILRTQSAVSQALKRLEAATGLELLDRSEYRLQLTEHGRAFEKRARLLLRDAASLQYFTRTLATGIEERVRIAAHGAVPARFWADAVAQVAAMFPDTVLEVAAGEVDEPVTALVNGSADLAILLLPPAYNELRQMEHQVIGAINFVCVTRRDRAASITEMPQVVVSDFAEQSRSFGVDDGRRYCRVSSHAAKLELILRGCGWGGLPEELVADQLARGLLVQVGPRGQPECIGSTSMPTHIHAYTSPDRRRGAVVGAVWNALATSGT